MAGISRHSYRSASPLTPLAQWERCAPIATRGAYATGLASSPLAAKLREIAHAAKVAQRL